jgi:hypothetical protein
LTSLSLPPIISCRGASIPKSALRSSQIRFDGYLRRHRSASVDDHLHPAIPYVLLT